MTHSILLIDDSEITLDLTKAVLTASGYEVVCATLFGAGLAAATSMAESLAHRTSPPDLILMDVEMPGIKGDEITRLFKQNWNIPVPILLYSSRSEAELRELVEQAGADGYISKDWEPEAMLARIAAQLDG